MFKGKNTIWTVQKVGGNIIHFGGQCCEEMTQIGKKQWDAQM